MSAKSFSSSEVVLSLQDLIVLYCLVHYRDMKIEELKQEGFTRNEAERAASTLGIATVWGNKQVMEHGGEPVYYEVSPGDKKPVPDGLVNRFIYKHSLPLPPLMYPIQFYRIADKLHGAGLLKGGEYRFVTTDAAEYWVRTNLDRISNPRDWPSYVRAQGGYVEIVERVASKLASW